MATSINKTRGKAAGLVGVVALFSALFSLLITQRASDAFVWVQGLVGLVCLGFYLATNLGDLGTKLTGRGTFYNVVSGVSALVLLAALVGINYIAVKKP